MYKQQNILDQAQASSVWVFIARVLLLPLIFIVLLIGILSYAETSIPLESLRQQFVKKASEVAGRDVSIEGEIRLAISFFPMIVVDQVHIANDEGWSSKDILTIEKARVQLALLPILSGQLEFIEISATAIQVNLEQASDGRKNWDSIMQPGSKTGNSPAREDTNADYENLWIDEFSLADVKVNYLDNHLGRKFTSRIDKLLINTHNRSSLAFDISGNVRGHPYGFTASADLLRNLGSNKPWQMTMQGHVTESPVNLDIVLQPSLNTLSGSIAMHAKTVDIGKTLSWLGLVEGLNAESNDLIFKANLSGSNLNEILDQSAFSIQLKNGTWYLHDTADEQQHKLGFNNALISAEKNQPLQLRLDGEIDSHPVKISLATNQLKSFFTTRQTVSIDMNTDIASSVIKLKGEIDLPVSRESFIMNVDIKGERLDFWSSLLKRKIPPYGPYRMRGLLKMDKNSIQISKLKLNVGESDLGGAMTIKTAGDIRNWNLNLTSDELQLKDFHAEGFSLLNPASSVKSGAVTATTDKKSGTMINASNELKDINFEHLPIINAELKIDAKKVVSGDDNLGNGHLHLILGDKSVSFENFHLNIPGGTIDGLLSARRVDDGIEGHLKLDMDKLDYGVLYRYYNPQSPAKGLISTKADLNLKGSSLGDALKYAGGTLDLAIWPENIDASELNIWSVNLLLAILPRLRKEESRFNCGVALLDFEQGKVSEELLFIDTTKVWMTGNLRASFPDETVSLALFPRSKTARLFSLQAPIRVRGTFAELGAHVKPFDLVNASLSFITSPLHAPFRRLFAKHIAADASVQCGQMLDREYLRTTLKEIQSDQPDWKDIYNSN